MSEPIDVRYLITYGYSGRYPLDPRDVIGVAIHHSVSGWQFFDDDPDGPEDEVSHLLIIDDYHVSQGWGGFGYHLAAFPSGRLYYCGDLHGARAHVASRNYELIGVVLIGDFQAQPPPDAQLTAAAHAVAFVRREYGPLPIDTHRAWALPTDPTACPGSTDWLPTLEQPPQEVTMTLNVPLLRRQDDDEVYADFGGALVHVPHEKYIADWDAVLQVRPDDPTFNRPTFYPNRDRTLP